MPDHRTINYDALKQALLDARFEIPTGITFASHQWVMSEKAVDDAIEAATIPKDEYVFTCGMCGQPATAEQLIGAFPEEEDE